jgi:hypothetical protein
VKDAVADGLLDTRRWESCTLLAADAAEALGRGPGRRAPAEESEGDGATAEVPT